MTSSAENKPSPDPQSVINKIVSNVNLFWKFKGLSTGKSADLRRARPGDLSSPTFWALYNGSLKEAGWDLEQYFHYFHLNSNKTERCFGVFFSICAIVGPFIDINLNENKKTSFGKALAIANMSQSRFVRLMRAEGERLEDELLIAAKFLSNKGQNVDPIDTLFLLLNPINSTNDRRPKIAKDYYTQLSKSEK